MRVMYTRHKAENVVRPFKALTKDAILDRLSPKARERLRRLRLHFWYRLFWPRPRWGGMRRTSPFHTGWGRGSSVDRVYIGDFIARHAEDIRGDVLEVGRSHYSSEFGDADTNPTIVDIVPSNAQATLLADLGSPDSLPAERFDCVILTQTLQLVRRPSVAVENCFRTFAAPQSGQAGSGSDIPTSSSKCDSQLMQTYS